MARRPSDDVIDLCDSDEDEDVRVLDDDFPRAQAGGAGPSRAAAAAADEEDDEAFARRLQEEEYTALDAPVAARPPPSPPLSHQPWQRHHDAGPSAGVEYARRERSEQDAAYEESLRADRKREADAAAAEKAKRDADAAAERAAADAEQAALRMTQRKEAARERWTSRAEPQDGAVILVLRFGDGTRLQRKFSAQDGLDTLFEAVAALGPFPDVDAPFALTWGYPRQTVLRDAQDARTLGEAGVEGAVMVVAADTA